MLTHKDALQDAVTFGRRFSLVAWDKSGVQFRPIFANTDHFTYGNTRVVLR